MVWRPPELPPVQKMPRRRKEAEGKPSTTARVVAALAGVAFGVSGLLGAWRAFNDASGQGSMFGSLAALLPTVLLIRYAVTGQIKLG